MKTSTKLVVAAALLGGAVWTVYAAVNHWRDDVRRDAADAVQDAQVARIPGLEKAVAASEARRVKEVVALQAQLDAARKAGATVAMTQHWTGTGGVVAVPCSEVAASPGTSASPKRTVPNAPETPPTASVTPHVRIDDAVLIDDGGGIYVARKVEARLTFGVGGSEWEPIEPDGAHAATVDRELAKAWRDWRAPHRQPWQLDLHAALGGPDPTGAIGGAFYPRGSRVGVIVQAQRTARELTTCSYQTEGCSSRWDVSKELLIGATWRLGPKR